MLAHGSADSGASGNAPAQDGKVGEAADVSGDDVRGGSSISRARRKVGLLRVGIEASAVDSQYRRSALDGRLLVTTAKQRAISMLPGAAYRLLATEASAQFSELLTVLGLSDAVDAGGSRCGICNGDDWHTLRPHEVGEGQVPAVVLQRQRIFYRCGSCQQIFWPGDKYESTMEGLRIEGREGEEAARPAGRAAMERARQERLDRQADGSEGVKPTWRPPTGNVSQLSLE